MADRLERIGQTIGDYRLIHWLGGGGFGNVYLAEHTHNRSQVAIKVLEMRLTKGNDFRAFLNEARTMRLQHPHIVPLLDFGLSYEDTPFLVMEYAPKGTLRDRHPKGSRVPLPTVVEYAVQVASALFYAHNQRVVHRDVKPENMLVRADGVILLSDFGIATTAHSTHSVNVNQAIGGTIKYMAPEQLEGKPRIESDQYALGMVIYEWLAGKCPFQGTTIEVVTQHLTKPPPSLIELVPGLPAEVEEVLFRALAKKAKDRFASIQAFLSALQEASDSPIFPKSAPSVSDESLPKDASPITLLPDALSPPMEDSPTILPLSVTQEPTMGREETLPAIGSLPRSLPTMPPEDERISLPARKHGLSRGQTAILLVMVLLLIAVIGGSYAYSAVNTYRVQAAATATAQTAIDNYNAYVAAHGMMFGFDAQHTRYNPYERIINVGNVSRLRQKWGDPTHGGISSSPAVANGMVYVGSWDHNLYAFDAATGKQKWMAPAGDYIDSSPAVANGMVYVGCHDNNLHAFDAATGKLKWKVRTGASTFSSPAVANGMVYVGSGDNYLYAFDAITGTGELKWPVYTYSLFSSPAIANGVVYVSSKDSMLYAFDAVTGQSKWVSDSIGKQLGSSPAVVNGVVYVGSDDHNLYAFDAVTGQQKWKAATDDWIFNSSPAVANGIVYISPASGNLYAFDAATGKLKWMAQTMGNGGGSSPTVANGVIYIGSADRNLYAFDAATGKQKWMASTHGSIGSSPAVANGMVYVGSDDGSLYAFSLP